MADLLDNPPSQTGSAVPEAVPPSARPQVMDGVVYLPAGRPVKPESEDFDQLLQQHLPPDIVADVIGQWHGVSRHASRLQWIVSLVCLLAAFGLLYLFFPKTGFDELKEHGGMEIRDLSGGLPLLSPYRSVYNAAFHEFSQENYHTVCQNLEKHVRNIIQTGDKTADKVLVLYFMAVRENQKVKSGSKGAGEAVRLLQKLINQNPHNPNWRQFEFVLNPRIRQVLDYEKINETINDLKYNRNVKNFIQRRLDASNFALERLNDLRSTTKSTKFTGQEAERLQESLDLYEVKLLISKWLLKGYETGKTSLPDDEGDPGVREREDALILALKHQRSNYRDFWKARLFIAKTLCKQDDIGLNMFKLNKIFWKREKHSTKAPLIQEIKDCWERLNGGQQL